MALPVILAVAGDNYVDPAHIDVVYWDGPTTNNHTVELRDRVTSAILVKMTRVTGSTGVLQPTHGISAPNGSRLAQISSGSLYVYLREPA